MRKSNLILNHARRQNEKRFCYKSLTKRNHMFFALLHFDFPFSPGFISPRYCLLFPEYRGILILLKTRKYLLFVLSEASFPRTRAKILKSTPKRKRKNSLFIFLFYYYHQHHYVYFSFITQHHFICRERSKFHPAPVGYKPESTKQLTVWKTRHKYTTL